MSLSDIIRSAVAQAHKITNDGKLQEPVYLYRWNGQDDTGAPEYASRLSLKALVVRKSQFIRTSTGEEALSTAHVTFLKPIPALSQADADRDEPIDTRDKIVLSDGSTGPILKTDGGVADPVTTEGYVLQAWMG